MCSDSTIQELQPFLLVGHGGEPIVVKSRHWEAQAVYLNDICLVVKLVHIKKNGELEIIKDDLYSLLMSINQTALEHDLMRPVAGVISEKDVPDDWKLKIKKWDSDQDWHRGAFTLFIEENDDKVKERIEDLIQLKIGIFSGYQTEAEKKEKKVLSLLRTDSQPGGLELIMSAVEEAINNNILAEKTNDISVYKELLQHIKSQAMNMAEKIAKGGK